jgi:hypothetical protein
MEGVREGINIYIGPWEKISAVVTTYSLTMMTGGFGDTVSSAASSVYTWKARLSDGSLGHLLRHNGFR